MKYYFVLPTSLKEIDKKDDNIDVCVETSDGNNYTFVIATEKNIIKHPGLRAIIVKKMTYHNIRKAINKTMKLEKMVIDYYGSNDDQKWLSVKSNKWQKNHSSYKDQFENGCNIDYRSNYCGLIEEETIV